MFNLSVFKTNTICLDADTIASYVDTRNDP